VFAVNNPVRYRDPSGLKVADEKKIKPPTIYIDNRTPSSPSSVSYVFYDPNGLTIFGAGAITERKVQQIGADLIRHYGNGHTVRYVPVQATEVDGVMMTAAEYFIYRFNSMGNDGSTIEAVVLYFHMSRNAIAFDAENGKKGEVNSRFITADISQLTNTQNIDMLILLGCDAGEGISNLATTFNNLLNVNYVVAADGDVSTTMINKGGTLRIFAGNGSNFRVFQSGVAPREIGRNFRSIGLLINAAR
jgi:hypothetical protein